MAAPTSAASDYYPDATMVPQGTLDFGAGSDTDPWLNQDPWMRDPYRNLGLMIIQAKLFLGTLVTPSGNLTRQMARRQLHALLRLLPKATTVWNRLPCE